MLSEHFYINHYRLFSLSNNLLIAFKIRFGMSSSCFYCPTKTETHFLSLMTEKQQIDTFKKLKPANVQTVDWKMTKIIHQVSKKLSVCFLLINHLIVCKASPSPCIYGHSSFDHMWRISLKLWSSNKVLTCGRPPLYTCQQCSWDLKKKKVMVDQVLQTDSCLDLEFERCDIWF